MSDHLLNNEYISANTAALKEAEKHKAEIDEIRKQRDLEHYKIHVEPYLKGSEKKTKTTTKKETKKTQDHKAEAKAEPKTEVKPENLEQAKKEVKEKIDDAIAKADAKLKELASKETKDNEIEETKPVIDMAGIQNIINKAK